MVNRKSWNIWKYEQQSKRSLPYRSCKKFCWLWRNRTELQRKNCIVVCVAAWLTWFVVNNFPFTVNIRWGRFLYFLIVEAGSMALHLGCCRGISSLLRNRGASWETALWFLGSRAVLFTVPFLVATSLRICLSPPIASSRVKRLTPPGKAQRSKAADTLRNCRW